MSKLISTPKECQLCHSPSNTLDYIIDGSTPYGWAFMCVSCHREIGRGLGMGKGQKYDLKTLEKVEG